MQLDFDPLRHRILRRLARPEGAEMLAGLDPTGVQMGLTLCAEANSMTELASAWARSTYGIAAAKTPVEHFEFVGRAGTAGLVYETLQWALDPPEIKDAASAPSPARRFAADVMTEIVCERIHHAPAQSGKAYWQSTP